MHSNTSPITVERQYDEDILAGGRAHVQWQAITATRGGERGFKKYNSLPLGRIQLYIY